MSKRSKYTDIELPELSFSPCWQTQSMVVVIWLARSFFSSAMCTIPLRTVKDLHCDENTHIGRIALWHAGAPSLPWCAHSNNPILQESPGSVDDLGAGLDGHLLLAAGDTMRHQTNILWKLPFPNALHLDSLFAVHNIVMDDAW